MHFLCCFFFLIYSKPRPPIFFKGCFASANKPFSAACKLHLKPSPRIHPARRPAKRFVADTHLYTPAKQPVNLRKRLPNFPQIFGRFQHAPYHCNRNVRKFRARNRQTEKISRRTSDFLGQLPVRKF